ncbi:MAG: ABC transporter permease [Pseudomonadota bacterium]
MTVLSRKLAADDAFGLNTRALTSSLARFSEDRFAATCLVMTTIFLALALLGPLFAMHPPGNLAAIELADSMLAPLSKSTVSEMRYLLGTDVLGRDVLSMTIFGLRTSLVVAFASSGGALLIGCAAGLAAAYLRGAGAAIIMRTVDIFLAVPSILFALLLISILGRGTENTVLAILLVQWTHYARAMNDAATAELGKDYVAAAQLQGFLTTDILARQIFPNCIAPISVILAVQFGYVIALEASLSFLGLGLPITQPSLGGLISEGQEYLMGGAYWISVLPGFVLLLLVFSINVVGDRLRALQNPLNARNAAC